MMEIIVFWVRSENETNEDEETRQTTYMWFIYEKNLLNNDN